MELIININIDNAAFSDIPAEEVSRILTDYIERINFDGQLNSKLYDFNGNYVGEAKLIQPVIDDTINIPRSLYKDLNRILNQVSNTKVSGLNHGKCSYDIVSALEKICPEARR